MKKKGINYLMPSLNFIKGYASSVANQSFKNIRMKKIGLVTCISLNRPDKKNSLNLFTLKELDQAIDIFEKDNESRVAVLCGERGNFCHGYDASDIEKNPKIIEEMDNIELIQKYSLKSIVAAVSGFATGPGFDLALWCDFRIVEDAAIMGGFARRFGMPLADATIRRMYSLLGLHKAMDLILTGRNMNSKEALESGVATRVVACGTGLGQAINFANSLANMPQVCLQADRAALISLSNKYSCETTKFIMEEKCLKRKLAVKEAEEGLYITRSGDVRIKS